MSYLVVRQLHKSFPGTGTSREPVRVVRDLSVSVERGEILALLGASGSGKTTLLRCIGGLERPDQGEISVDGQLLYASSAGTDLPPHKRNMGMVFQSYALWPHMTAAQNIAYPLERRAIAAAECEARVREYLELVGCGHLGERFPHHLSGGQQQRIALARALVAQPRLVLFDEPLSNLDANLREQLRFQIRDLKRRLGFTAVYVTHDHAEANFIADRIAIIGDGVLQQLGTADELYGTPSNRAVAEFLGFINSLPGDIVQHGDELGFRSAAGLLALDPVRVPDRLRSGSQVMLKCHPGRVRLAAPEDAAGLPATVVDRVRSSEGSTQYIVELAGGSAWQCAAESEIGPSIGSRVHVQLAPAHIHLFEGVT